MPHDLFLKTFRDVIEHLVDYGEGLAPAGQERAARRAVVAAYRKVWLDGPWSYFLDDRRIPLEADYSTGTVAFDLTGGLYERMLTLTGGTWPDNAAYGRIEIDNIQYKVDQRKSDTVLTLISGSCPVADVAAGETYTWYRTEYPLVGVHRIWEMNDEAGYFRNHYVSPEEWLARERHFPTSGRPFFWTLAGGRDFYGGLGIRTSGYPTAASTMDFIAEVRPRSLVLDGYASAWNTGTVTSATGTTAVISGNTFANEVIGAVIRFSRNSSVPTDVEGGNPFIDQRIITAASSGTLTLDDSVDFAGVTVSNGYCVSDPVDLPEQLYDLLLAWSEHEYARISVRNRLAEAAAVLRTARLDARAWNKQIKAPSVPFPWGMAAWAYTTPQITAADTYTGDPL